MENTKQPDDIKEKVEQLTKQALSIMNSDPVGCIELGRTILDISASNNYKHGIGLGCMRIGMGYAHQGDYQEAQKYYQQAEKVFIEESDYNMLVSLYNNMGVSNWYRGDMGKALKLFSQALELQVHSNNPAMDAAILTNIGLIYIELNDYGKAHKNFEEALQICTQNNNDYGRAIVVTNIGNLHVRSKEWEKAEKSLLMVISLTEKIQNFHCSSDAYINYSKVKSSRGQYDEGLELVQKALRYAEQLNDRRLIAEIYLEIAEIYKMSNRIDKQEEFLLKSLELSEPNDYRSLALSANEQLAALYEIRDDFKKSLYYYKNMNLLKDFLFDEKRMRTIHELITKMEVEKAEKEKEQYRLKALELEKQNRMIVVQTTFDKLLSNEESPYKKRIVFRSDKMKEILQLMDQVAKADNTGVLITGESGTGKELVARGIHLLSSRENQVFYDVNCTAVPESLFESEFFGHTKNAFTGAVSSKKGGFEIANKGTIFLDEIGDMPMNLQAKLLRVLEERKIRRVGSSDDIFLDVRIIASTNQNLMERVEKKRFREDLYYRLNKFNIHIPPLRERTEDIQPLIDYYVDKFCISMRKPLKQFSPETVDMLIKYIYPGNIRELRNIVEKSIILSDPADEYLTIRELYPQSHTKPENVMMSDLLELDLEQLQEVEKEIIVRTMKITDNNKTKAAKLLKIKRGALLYRIEKHGLSFPG